MGQDHAVRCTDPVPYMERTRDYYAAQGYPKPYQWAQADETPFTVLRKPVTESTLALITTASPMRDRKPGDGVSPSGETLLMEKATFSGSIDEPPAQLFTGDLSWDKETTHTEDLGSFFPLAILKELVAAGELGALASRYHCVPTEYSQRQTLEQDAPLIRDRAIEDGADIALLVPL
ncbi:MAG: hypothetical protein AAGI15_04730 [Pseudomonadota bacterium]